MRQLALHVGDEAFAEEALRIDSALDKKPVTLLIEDPLFNLAYDEMELKISKSTRRSRMPANVPKCGSAWMQ